jgi:hypothetical protein
MAESPMVAHAEILDSKQYWSETAIAPSFRLRLRRMSTFWKGNFINISIELYFCICSIPEAGVNPRIRVSDKAMTIRWRRYGHGVNKEKMGQRFHNTYMMKFRS